MDTETIELTDFPKGRSPMSKYNSSMGLEGKEKEVFRKLYDKINVFESKSRITWVTIYPVVRCIVRKIFSGYYKLSDEEIDMCINLIDISGIIVKLDIMYKDLLPLYSEHFKSLDPQAELTMTFCYDYYCGIIDQVSKIKKQTLIN